ncbi:hypothetical protein ABB02_00469 [Clostridiaceae bacterium JG1575]|nr:hypothetical protein ABB02_00469 [Clostridiaceae bacterium JG1575]
MITVRISGTPGRLSGMIFEGHADFAQYGEDIICSAVTAQLMMAYNGLSQIAKAPMASAQLESGWFLFRLLPMSPEKQAKAQLIMQTLKMGLENIQTLYEDHINVITNEMEV